MSKKEWFEEWFDTKYYHILYQNRNEEEADMFVSNLSDHLGIPKGSKVLDLACGKGRHAVILHKKGFQVLGVDLSSKSIQQAQKRANTGLSFAVHDMREPITNETFDAVFNLFTSFGYFDDKTQNKKMCSSIADMLRPGGKLVIDFMNANKVIRCLVGEEYKKINEISFKLNRTFDGTHIIKRIQFEDEGEWHDYEEKVQAFRLKDFELMLTPYFTIDSVFGSFDLEPFIAEESDRLIIIATRKS